MFLNHDANESNIYCTFGEQLPRLWYSCLYLYILTRAKQSGTNCNLDYNIPRADMYKHIMMTSSSGNIFWREALMFSLICALTNGLGNNRDAGDLRHHCVHYDITQCTFLERTLYNYPVIGYEQIYSATTVKRFFAVPLLLLEINQNSGMDMWPYFMLSMGCI